MKLEKDTNIFFKSKPVECSYIKNKSEQRLFLNLNQTLSKNFKTVNELTKIGFRRNLNFMYLPFCNECSKCISTRINVHKFNTSKSQKRNLKKNRSISFLKKVTNKNNERYKLFKKYLGVRHTTGQMNSMTEIDFNNFFYNTPTESLVFDLIYEKKILGSILLDILYDGMSAVYSFYDPKYIKNGLGIFLILKSIQEVKKLKKKFLYLGYWVEGSKKMDYKKNFDGLEFFRNGHWLQNLI